MQLPNAVSKALNRLNDAGFEAYIVGGCVRDSLLGLQPHDWDICTTATPEQMTAVFAKERRIETGMVHGTLTVILDEMPLEITTFRTEGTYSDNRRPDQVTYVTNLQDDLCRRDFTVNAMAYHPAKGLIDCFGGQEDLKAGVIRCVGEPVTRFREDALRILRALRFASDYGWTIDDETAAALLENRALLKNIAVERIQAEFSRLLTGKGVGEILRRFAPVILVFIPEMAKTIGCEQYSKYHYLDVWGHIASSLENAKEDLIVRLTLFFHDAGKPQCFTLDSDGHGHFWGHAEIGSRMASRVLRRLHYDRHTIETVTRLILYHDMPVPQRRVKRWMCRIGAENFDKLLDVKRGDCLGHSAFLHARRLREIEDARDTMNRILADCECYRVADLAVTGGDLMACGVPVGKAVGHTLQWLLARVMEDKLPNERGPLLDAVKKRLKERDSL